MNNPKTKVYIEFLYINDDQIKEMYTSRAEAFHTVKEYEISGFSGHSKAFKFIDVQTGKEVSFQMSVRWDLAKESLYGHISNPEVIAEQFSMLMLSTGSYFWRFYSGLYTQLLADNRTQPKAIKMLNELFYVIGSSNRAKLVPTLFNLIKDSTSYARMECHHEDCMLQFKLFHALLLCFDQASEEYQPKLAELCGAEPCMHYLRVVCQAIPGKHQVQLGRILLRRFSEFLKKRKHLATTDKKAYANLFHLYYKHLATWLEDMAIGDTSEGELAELHTNVRTVLEEFNKVENNDKKKKKSEKNEEDKAIVAEEMDSTSDESGEWSTEESSSSNEKTSDLETTGTQLDSDISDSDLVDSTTTKEKNIKVMAFGFLSP